MTEVVAERVQFMSRTKGAAGAPAAVPAVQPYGEEAPTGGGSGDDDVPF